MLFHLKFSRTQTEFPEALKGQGYHLLLNRRAVNLKLKKRGKKTKEKVPSQKLSSFGSKERRSGLGVVVGLRFPPIPTPDGLQPLEPASKRGPKAKSSCQLPRQGRFGLRTS